jgi:1-acyl-sn-glycerol-3-phosphate acyltransferase
MTEEYLSPQVDDFINQFGDWFRDWGDKDWENRILDSGTARLNELGYDPFGMSPAFIKKVVPIIRFLYRAYFRVSTHGLYELPTTRLMFVSNHSGQLPFDGALIAAAVAIEGKPPRIVRSMVERWVPSLPFVSLFMARCGQVLGDPENSRRLLENDEAILVFPEGVRGISKLFSQRYQLRPFGSGFMRQAIETKTPVAPVAVIGAEESMPAFFNLKRLARLVGAPAFPVTPTFPWLLLLGLVPYPVKIHIYFGEPMTFSGDPNDEDDVIEAKVKQVQDRVAELIRRGLKERGPFPFSVLGNLP